MNAHAVCLDCSRRAGDRRESDPARKIVVERESAPDADQDENADKTDPVAVHLEHAAARISAGRAGQQRRAAQIEEGNVPRIE
jgi:hypothetical protein